MDKQPVFIEEYKIWAVCMSKLYKDSAHTIRAYFIDEVNPEVELFSIKYGIEIKIVPTLIPESPHSNKIIPLLAEDIIEYDGIVITDSDLYMVQAFDQYFIEGHIRLAPNNQNNPPSRIFESVFRLFGLPLPFKKGIALFPGHNGLQESYINNNSGGIIMVPADQARKVGELWKNNVLRIISEAEILERWRVHVDQVGFAIVMAQLGKEIFFLPPQLNCILKMMPLVSDITGFHIAKAHKKQYAEWFSNDNLLEYQTDNAELHRSIALLNQRITEANTIVL